VIQEPVTSMLSGIEIIPIRLGHSPVAEKVEAAGKIHLMMIIDPLLTCLTFRCDLGITTDPRITRLSRRRITPNFVRVRTPHLICNATFRIMTVWCTVIGSKRVVAVVASALVRIVSEVGRAAGW